MHSLKRAALAVAISCGLVMASATPSAAWGHLPGFFYNSAIADGVLTVCYGSGVGDPITDNRWAFADHLNSNTGLTGWRSSVYLNFQSVGACVANTTANIAMTQVNLGPCGFGDEARTQSASGGYSSIGVWLNANCVALGQYDFDWRNGTMGGYFSANAIMTHEVGHALGLAHVGPGTGSLMDVGGPDHCSLVGSSAGIAFDDAMSIRNKYPGLTPTHFMFPVNGYCSN